MMQILYPFSLIPIGVLALACGPQPMAGTAQGGREAPGDAAQEEPRVLPDLPPLTGVGPVAPEKWKVQPFKRGSSADTITLMRAETGFTVEDTIVQASARTAFICYQGGGPYRGTTLRNSILRVEPKTLWLNRSYWAFRGYDMIDTVIDHVEITDFGQVSEKHDEGHAMYFNVAGSLTITNCNIHHNGGQGLQLVNRPHESKLPRGAAKGAITIRNTRFAQNGFNPDRGATQVSIFGTGQAIVMEDVAIVAGQDDTKWPGDWNGGGLLIEAEGYDPRRPDRPVWWRPDKLPEDWEMPFSQKRVELTRVRVFHKQPNRPIVQIKGCEELIVRDCRFGIGRIELDLPQKAGRDCGHIVWQGNSGPAQVFHKGKRLGTASDDFEIGAPPKKAEKDG